jgi:hypothetical protein
VRLQLHRCYEDDIPRSQVTEVLPIGLTQKRLGNTIISLLTPDEFKGILKLSFSMPVIRVPSLLKVL